MTERAGRVVVPHRWGHPHSSTSCPVQSGDRFLWVSRNILALTGSPTVNVKKGSRGRVCTENVTKTQKLEKQPEEVRC